jgi:hypothetical protein
VGIPVADIYLDSRKLAHTHCSQLTHLPRLDRSLARSHRLAEMMALIEQQQQTVFSPSRGAPQMEEACHAAQYTHGGFWGPWVP